MNKTLKRFSYLLGFVSFAFIATNTYADTIQNIAPNQDRNKPYFYLKCDGSQNNQTIIDLKGSINCTLKVTAVLGSSVTPRIEAEKNTTLDSGTVALKIENHATVVNLLDDTSSDTCDPITLDKPCTFSINSTTGMSASSTKIMFDITYNNYHEDVIELNLSNNYLVINEGKGLVFCKIHADGTMGDDTSNCVYDAANDLLQNDGNTNEQNEEILGMPVFLPDSKFTANEDKLLNLPTSTKYFIVTDDDGTYGGKRLCSMLINGYINCMYPEFVKDTNASQINPNFNTTVTYTDQATGILYVLTLQNTLPVIWNSNTNNPYPLKAMTYTKNGQPLDAQDQKLFLGYTDGLLLNTKTNEVSFFANKPHVNNKVIYSCPLDKIIQEGVCDIDHYSYTVADMSNGSKFSYGHIDDFRIPFIDDSNTANVYMNTMTTGYGIIPLTYGSGDNASMCTEHDYSNPAYAPQLIAPYSNTEFYALTATDWNHDGYLDFYTIDPATCMVTGDLTTQDPQGFLASDSNAMGFVNF